MRITVLTYVEEGERSRSFDAVVPQVARALRALGHKVSILGVHADVNRLIRGLRRRRPELVFNLLEMFGDDLHADIDVAGLLELLDLAYTGCGPGEYYLSQDKALSKRLLAYEQLLYPRFAVFSDETGLETGGNLRMPLFVKPLRSDSSIGIGSDSLVHDAEALRYLIQLFGDEKIALGSDYPFPLGEHIPGALIESMADLSPATKANLLAENARAWLGIQKEQFAA